MIQGSVPRLESSERNRHKFQYGLVGSLRKIGSLLIFMEGSEYARHVIGTLHVLSHFIPRLLSPFQSRSSVTCWGHTAYQERSKHVNLMPLAPAHLLSPPALQHREGRQRRNSPICLGKKITGCFMEEVTLALGLKGWAGVCLRTRRQEGQNILGQGVEKQLGFFWKYQIFWDSQKVGRQQR